MKGIKLFLDKFKHLKPTNKFIKEEFILSIKIILNVDIEKENISIQNNIIYTNTTPSLKSEIFLKKRDILNELSNRISKYDKNITDIR